MPKWYRPRRPLGWSPTDYFMMSANTIAKRPLGARDVIAVVERTVKSKAIRQKNRVFYHLRKIKRAWNPVQGPPAPIVKIRPRVEVVVPSIDVRTVENRFNALRDLVEDAPPEVLTDLEVTMDKAPISETAEVFVNNRTEAKRWFKYGYFKKPDHVGKRRYSLPEQEIMAVDQATSVDKTNASIGQVKEVNEDGVELEQDSKIFVPSRKNINKYVKNKKSVKVCSKLLNHLRCKYHLTLRDKSLPSKLVHEARTWMKKAGYTCETDLDYTILSSAVTAAFLVSDEELEFRKMIKNRQNYENMYHLNETLQGNLGKTAVPLLNGGSIFRGLMRDNRLPSPSNSL